MKIITRLENKNAIDTYYKQNGMYQTTIEYMKMFKGSLSAWSCYWPNRVRGDSELKARVILFHIKDEDDTDAEISKGYHRFNDEYIRLPYNTGKDIALSVVNNSRDGDVSFIFHENETGIYDEIRYVCRNVSMSDGYTVIDEI